MPKGTPKRIQPTSSNNIEPLEDTIKGTSSPPRVLRSSASPAKLTPSPLKPSPSKKSSPRPKALKLKAKVADERNETPSRNTPSREVDTTSQSGIEEASPRRNLRSSLSPNKKVVPLEKSTPQRNMKSRPKKKAVRKTSLPRRTEDKDEEERTPKKSRTATAMTKKAKTNEHNTAFRSGLSSMVNLFKELNDHQALRVEHDEKMKSTPFGSLYSILRDGKLSEEDVRKPTGAIISILSSYSRKDNAFSVGGKLVKFQVEDVTVIFGLLACGKKPRLSTRTISENCQSDFVNRYWPDCKIITSKLLTSAIRGVAHKVTEKDVEDFCKMIIMFMLLTIFNPGNGAGIRLSCIPLIDDFEGLGKIGWATILHEALDAQVKNWEAAEPFSITSCSVLLLYFLLEHSNIVEPKQDYDEKYPRCAKWSFEELKKKLRGIANIKDLKNVKVTDTLTLNGAEEALFQNVFPIEDASHQKISSLEELVDSLNARNVALVEENERLKMVEQTAAEENESLTADITLLQYRLQQGESEIGRLKSENQMLRDRLSLFEEKETKIEEKASGIEEKNTPPVTSAIKELKKKTRKKLVLADYEYQDVVVKKKKRAETTIEDEKNNVAPTNVIPETQKKLRRFPPVDSSPYWPYMTRRNQKLIDEFFKNNLENCIALKDSDGLPEILGRDIKNILFDEFISERVIDWFGRYLIKGAESSSSSDQYQAEIFPSCLFGYFLDKKETYLKRELDDRVRGLDFGNTEALMFPMIHRKNAADKEGFHWTLLVLDTTEWSWSHYDSLRPRRKNSKSKTLDDATLYKSRIASTLKRHKGLKKDEKDMVDADVNVEDCPQQGDT